MRIELNDDELSVLNRNLDRQLRALQDEVAHTEKRPLQVELGREIQALERVRDKLRPAADELGSAVNGVPV